MRNTLPILSSLLLVGISAQGQNASFYKEPPLFSTAPDPNKSVEIIARFRPPHSPTLVPVLTVPGAAGAKAIS